MHGLSHDTHCAVLVEGQILHPNQSVRAHQDSEIKRLTYDRISLAEYLVPCSTQSQVPYLWSAALHCTHGMAIFGDPGADEMGVPSRSCNPRERGHTLR